MNSPLFLEERSSIGIATLDPEIQTSARIKEDYINNDY
jgi:hypothetical protein